MMSDNKRKSHRFDNSIFVEFRPVDKSDRYTLGTIRNFSSAGFSFESQNYDLETGEDLELRLKHPQSDLVVSVLGETVWKEKSDFECTMGIRLKEMDKSSKNKLLEIISTAGNIYTDSFLYGEDIGGVLKKKGEEIFLESSSEKTEVSGINKQYMETAAACKVTFRFPREAAPEAKKVTIVGDFNGWDKDRILMKRIESGDFSVTLELESGREYRFKYLIDGERWENDWSADKYIPSPHGYDDSVVIV